MANAVITKSVEDGPNHMLAIYSSDKEKMAAAFKFLKEGLYNKDSIVFITDELDEIQIIEIMQKECAELDVNKLLKEGMIRIVSSSEWYFSDDLFEPDQAKKKLEAKSLDYGSCESLSYSKAGSNRIRIFGDLKPVFKKLKSSSNDTDLLEKLIEYEGSLGKRFSSMLMGLCAYEAEDIADLDKKQITSLMAHHGLVHADNYNEIINPSTNSHIILLYDDQEDLDIAISEYINEGLKRGQLCVHASVYLQNDNYIKNFSSKIIDFDNNVKNGNLILVNLAEHYIGARTHNLQHFDTLKETISNMSINDEERKDKHVRLTADCATLLLKNKHFEECINLEDWWHAKPFNGSYICPYPKSLLNQFPYNYYLFKLFHHHDVVIDTDKNLAIEYVKNSEHHSELISKTADKIMTSKDNAQNKNKSSYNSQP